MNAVLICLFYLTFATGNPNLIGYSEDEIRDYMKNNEKGFAFQNFTNNSTFRYLKYTDRGETQTILFFFDSDLRCKLVRLVCDLNLRSSKIKELDKQYTRTGDFTWKEIKNGKQYSIELREEDTTFNINIQMDGQN